MEKKVCGSMNIKFDSEPVYGNSDKYIKTKIKSYGDKKNTRSKSTKRKCIILLQECKYEIKKYKMKNSINDDFDLSSSGKSDNERDSEQQKPKC